MRMFVCSRPNRVEAEAEVRFAALNVCVGVSAGIESEASLL